MHITVRACKVGVLLLASLLFTVGCGSDEASSPPVGERVDPPVAPGSGQPRLYTAPNGTVWMSWLDPVSDSTHALRYATLTDTSWSAPVTVATGTDWFVNWADLPSVRPLPGGRAAAHVLESNGSGSLAYAVRVTQRTRDGTWQDAVTPHADGTPTEHGFVSLVPWPDDRLLTIWLDGRNMTGDGHGQGDMTLRSAVLDASGTVTQRHRVDGRTCECCATSAVRVGDEALLAYRDRSNGEVRDISVARFDGEQWSDPTRLHTDDWNIEGCPVNGPALASEGEAVVAAWFTAAGGTPRVKAALSTDGGRHFTDPVVVAEGNTQGRVDAVLLDDGTAVVSWLGTRGDRGQVQVRAVRADRSLSPVSTLAALPSASRHVGFPKLAQSGNHLYGVWVGRDNPSHPSEVQMARMRLDDGPTR